MSIDKLYKAKQNHDKLVEFANELKKNPLQVSQYKNLIVNSGEDPKIQQQMLSDLPKYQKQGLVIDDIKQSYNDFSSHHIKEKTGKYPIPSSVYKNLNDDERSVCHLVDLAIYEDVSVKSLVPAYRDKYGMQKSHGSKPNSSARYEQVDLKTQEGVDLFNQGVKARTKAKEWFKINAPSMINGRGEKYNKYMPLKRVNPELVEKAKRG